MNLLNQIMSYEKIKNDTQENCNCSECISIETLNSNNQIIEYPKLSEEEIEKIISERYSYKDEKTKKFISKALRIHGDKYDYSNVIYLKSKEKVEIICRVEGHKPFPQRPNDHLRGKGCKICGGTKKLTLEEFIEKANEVHGIGRYDYSKSIYKGMFEKIEIVCPKHDTFWQEPHNHINNQGCPHCNESKGETKIRMFLIKHDIIFEREKRFDDCRYKKPLPFDFYIPKYNLCIEFDGSCHFNKTNWGGKLTDEQMKENLKFYKLRDDIKNNYCKNNNINLIRLNNFKTIEKTIK